MTNSMLHHCSHLDVLGSKLEVASNGAWRLLPWQSLPKQRPSIE